MSESSEQSDPATETSPSEPSDRGGCYKAVLLVFGLPLVFVAVTLFVSPVNELFSQQQVVNIGIGMEPTVHSGETVLVTAGERATENLRPGDVVAMSFAPGTTFDGPVEGGFCIDSQHPSQLPFLLRRVIAIGPATVEIRGNDVYVDGQPVAQTVESRQQTDDSEHPYETTATETLGDKTYRVIYRGLDPNFGPIEIPADHVFLLGDNRDYSSDSRCWGVLPKKHLLGRVHHVLTSMSGDGVDWDRIGHEL